MTGTPDLLPIAVRAYTAPTTPRRPWKPRTADLPSLVLVLDTETTTDPTQRLLFGVWQVYQDGDLIDAGVFPGDDLTMDEQLILSNYVQTHAADTLHPLRLLSRREFLNEVFWKVAYKARGLVVGFNLPFDLARLAVESGAARGTYYGGGFSLTLWEYEKDGQWHEDRYRPRITVKSIDSKRSLMGFTKRREPDDTDLIPEGSLDGTPDPAYTFPGYFVDLRAWTFALTNESHSLESACEAFGVKHGKQKVTHHGVITPAYIDYAQRDVLATYELFEKLLEEHERHPIALPPTKAFSPASVGKTYQKAMGIPPPLERWADFPPEVLGYAMTAYYGGRAECRIRRTPVPVVYLDFLSMYPTDNTLMGLWDFLTAKRIEVVDATEETRELLARVTLDDCFDPAFWRQLPVLVQIEPEGDIIPVRARYDRNPTWQIALTILAGGEPRWYTLADCIASTILSGKPPRVRRALRFVPHGQQAGLRDVLLRGEIPVDPGSEDFFRVVIERRKSLPDDLSDDERDRLGGFLKVLANSTSYGIFAEMNRQDPGSGKKERVTVHGLDAEPFLTNVSGPEEPGAFCFPPLAAFIAGAARLMLAMTECSVTDLGGSYAMCDTDSMAIVASEEGGLVPCAGGEERLGRKEAIRTLSWTQAEEIRQRFARLNPYDPDKIPGSVLKLEDVNFVPCGIAGHKPKCVCTGLRRQLWCYAISAKRYCLYTLDENGDPVLVKWSEHGLGHLLNPTDPDSDDRKWMRRVWEGLLREELGLPHEWPEWLDRPALSRHTISSPELLKPFANLNTGKDYPDQVKPFSFMLIGHVHPFGYPEGVDPARFQLIAPYETDPTKWLHLPWIDRCSGQQFRVSTTAAMASPGRARLKTYRDVIGEFRTHPEAKSCGPDGRPCDRQTVGLLGRRVVQETYIVHDGKEANKLEEVEAGLEQDPEVIYTEYQHPDRNEWRLVVLPMLRQMPQAELAEAAGLSVRRLRDVLKGRAQPHQPTKDALLRIAIAFAQEHLREEGLRSPTDGLTACATALQVTAEPTSHRRRTELSGNVRLRK